MHAIVCEWLGLGAKAVWALVRVFRGHPPSPVKGRCAPLHTPPPRVDEGRDVAVVTSSTRPDRRPRRARIE